MGHFEKEAAWGRIPRRRTQRHNGFMGHKSSPTLKGRRHTNDVAHPQFGLGADLGSKPTFPPPPLGHKFWQLLQKVGGLKYTQLWNGWS